MTPHRILVTGSRDWIDPSVIREAFIIVEYTMEWEGAGGRYFSLVSGACPTGADAIAEEVADDREWTIERYPAQWENGKGAGFERNRLMVASQPELALAFQRNGSRGTGHTIELCRKADIPIWIWSKND